MLFEPSTILNTGDAVSDYTVKNLKRLQPEQLEECRLMVSDMIQPVIAHLENPNLL
jgi:hypothetical protein